MVMKVKSSLEEIGDVMSIKNVGIIYITNEGNIGFDFNDKHFEVRGFSQLKELKSVLMYDKVTGFIMVDTNYGEEFFELFEVPDVKGILKDIQEQFVTFLKKELSLVDSFKVDMSRNKNPLYINGVKTLI